MSDRQSPRFAARPPSKARRSAPTKLSASASSRLRGVAGGGAFVFDDDVDDRLALRVQPE